jgi:hypothetical protein
VVRRHGSAAAGPAPRRAGLQSPGPDHRAHPPGHRTQPVLRAPCSGTLPVTMSSTSRSTPTTSSRSPRAATGAPALATPPSHDPRGGRPKAPTGPARGCQSPPRPASIQRQPSSRSPRPRSPGALNSVNSSHRTMRYQELLVIAVTACHMANSAAPLGLLDHLAGLHPRGIPGPGGGTTPPVRAQGTRTRTHPAIRRASP